MKRLAIEQWATDQTDETDQHGSANIGPAYSAGCYRPALLALRLDTHRRTGAGFAMGFTRFAGSSSHETPRRVGTRDTWP
jgi:hypothetical protein